MKKIKLVITIALICLTVAFCMSCKKETTPQPSTPPIIVVPPVDTTNHDTTVIVITYNMELQISRAHATGTIWLPTGSMQIQSVNQAPCFTTFQADQGQNINIEIVNGDPNNVMAQPANMSYYLRKNGVIIKSGSLFYTDYSTVFSVTL